MYSHCDFLSEGDSVRICKQSSSASSPIKIGKEEIIEKVNEVFDKFDTDKNGSLDLQELKPYFFCLKKSQISLADIIYEDFFFELDTNGDQVISK